MFYSNKIACVALLCVVFCVDWSTQDKMKIHIKPANALELRKQAEVCSKETGVSPDNLKKVIDKTLPDDKPHSQFFKCTAFNAGYADNDGHFIVDKLLTFEVLTGTPEDFANTIKECNKITKGDDLETLTATANCIHDKYVFSL